MKTRLLGLGAQVAIVFFLGAAIGAKADTIPGSQYHLYTGNGADQTSEQQFSSGILNSTPAGYTASGGPGADGPSVSASGSGTNTGGIGSYFSASAVASWDFQIIGPSSAPDMYVSVPLTITGSFALTQSGYGESSVDIGLGTASGIAGGYGTQGGTYGCSASGGCGSSSFTASVMEEYKPSNTNIYSVVITATGDIDYGGPGTFSALIDPTIAIDNSSGNYSGYSLIISSDALPVSGTPLPATLPLFAGGLGFVAFLARRRKSSKRVLTAA